MSVNITVNGKFARHCRSHPLLEDPQEVRKAEEKERRKLRLLQVREQSKKIAKKIRDEVNEEKKRELLKLRAKREQEFECWRQHALQSKGSEHSAAIFQIGTAHQAAKKENDEKVYKQTQHGSYKDFQKQIAARKCQPGKVNFKCQSVCPCQQILPDASKQFKCTCTQTDKQSMNNKHEAHKRKRDLSITSSESECEDEGFKEQTTLPQLSSTCDSTSSFSNIEVTESSILLPSKNKCLIKTPAVFLDVEVGTDDSVTISAPAEIKDKHVEYNRQFNSVIKVSPRKGRKQTENTSEKTAVQQSTTNTTSATTVATNEYGNTSSLESPKTQLNIAHIPKVKRFTIISELVKKQQANEAREIANMHIPSCPPNSQTSTTVTPHLSPKKQTNVSLLPAAGRSPTQSPHKISGTSKSSRTTTTQPFTAFRAAGNSNTFVATSNSGRVQFYDYNSKLAREKDQAATTACAQRQRDQSKPTAMEQAELENQKEKEKNLEALKKLQVIEERGQKALEREQIRRDCNELTEKLEVLSREYANQLPTNDNQPHIFADKQLRKEGKMNSAIEKLLQRPNIITCSELNKPVKCDDKHKLATNEKSLANLLNVASLNSKPLPADDVSSDSCCSILLGYVDDQSRLIKQDLQKNGSNPNQSKQNRLKNLLKRLDQLRNSLVEELRNETESKEENRGKKKSEFTSKEENIKQLIDSISQMRREHEDLMINEEAQQPKSLSEREKELQAKELLLERKVREFYELQKQKKKLIKTADKKDSTQTMNKGKYERDDNWSSNGKKEDLNINSNDKENEICTSGENPLEIIITVRGDTKCVKKLQKPKRKFAIEKRPSKLATLIKSPQPSTPLAKKHVHKRKTQAEKALYAQNMLRRDNSYDSNSTSYISLPPELPTKIDHLSQHLSEKRLEQPKKLNNESETVSSITSPQNKQQESEISLESENNAARLNRKPYINPLIAQYVQQLLGMTRNAVQNLGVSSSDVETPGSSIINTTGNIAESETIISDERLISLHNFIEENKSFIKDLEQSIKLQQNVSLENSMRIFDDIWRKRLKRDNMEAIKSKQHQEVKEVHTDKLAKTRKINQKTSLESKEKQKTLKNNEKLFVKTRPNKTKPIERRTKSTDNLSYDSNDNKSLKATLKTPKRRVETVDKAIDAKLSMDSSKSEPDSQMARYAKLTENCTHRIAELTELINRVREEKQRLLEVTLSSVSDNGRPSTDYPEPSESKSKSRNKQDDLTRISSSSEETIINKQSSSSDTLQDMPKLSSADKNKLIANSRDSGIAESRPITALENRNDQEPVSQTSESTMPQAVRKTKPPPTLNRFSPQLPEDELGHELSTIFEVDTPATAHINMPAGHAINEKGKDFNNGLQQPVKFATFEQYIKEIGLDITQLDQEESMQLQQEFASFLEYLQKHPSAEDLADGDPHASETMEECLAKLSIIGQNHRNFPPLREYVKCNESKPLTSSERELLDTASLNNITDAQTCTNTDNDSDSLDIEKELKKRKILKKSFRVIEGEILAVESGVDRLSTSGNTSDLLDSDLKRMVKQWRGDLRTKPKQTRVLSSTTTSTTASALAKSALKAASLDSTSKGSGCAFNLRDFLTRELEKLANNSGSTTNSSNDESLRSHFLHSLIDSLTPRTAGAASKSGAPTLDRQRTSTPVAIQSSQTKSTASHHSSYQSQLFSGESHLSSVHHQDRLVRCIASEDGHADQSSE